MSRSAHRATVLTALAIGLLVAACGGAPAGAASASSPSPAAAAGTAVKPDFDLVLDGAVELPGYASDRAAGLNSCDQATSGGWTYLYGGGSPFVTVTASIYSAVTDGSNPSDFDLDISAPGGRAVRLVPSGRKEGAQGTGTATITSLDGGGVTIQIDGSAVTLEGGPASKGDTEVHLTLRCPG